MKTLAPPKLLKKFFKVNFNFIEDKGAGFSFETDENANLIIKNEDQAKNWNRCLVDSRLEFTNFTEIHVTDTRGTFYFELLKKPTLKAVSND